MAVLLYSFRVGKVLVCMLYAAYYRILVALSRIFLRNHRIFSTEFSAYHVLDMAVCQQTSQPGRGSCLSVSAPREKEG